MGYEFEAKAPFEISALGRALGSKGSLQDEVEVTLWDTGTHDAVARAGVGPHSRVLDGYAYTLLPEPFEVAMGSRYRISQMCTDGMPDRWSDDGMPGELDRWAIRTINLILAISSLYRFVISLTANLVSLSCFRSLFISSRLAQSSLKISCSSSVLGVTSRSTSSMVLPTKLGDSV